MEHYKKNGKIAKFGDIEIHKPMWIENTDINKIVASNKVFFGKKCFKYFYTMKNIWKLK